MYYWAIVHNDPGSAYGVTFPDLEGCFSAADEPEGVMAAAIEAVDLYLESEPAPAPMTLAAVRDLFKDDLANGAYLIQVPAIKRTSKSVRINVSLDQGLVEAIDSAANRAGLTRSAFMGMAARETINGQQSA